MAENSIVDLTNDDDEGDDEIFSPKKSACRKRKHISAIDEEIRNIDENKDYSNHNNVEESSMSLKERLMRKGTLSSSFKTELPKITSLKHSTSPTAVSSSDSGNFVLTSKPSEKEASSYLKARANSVKSKSFDISKSPAHEIIRTGRTIKKMTGWKGLWPAIREFMQNTIDHLNILDHNTGRRNAALELNVTNHQNEVIYTFSCGGESICTIYVKGNDELIIEQAYTFPLPARALDTGVPDVTKLKGDTAGGFGDGFKTAAVALIALGENIFKELKWTFYIEKEKIAWNFVGCDRDAIGTFAACQVLEVHITKTPLSSTHHPAVKNNTMQQHIHCKDIGKVFLNEAVSKLQVFWHVNESLLISVPSHNKRGGGSYLADVLTMPTLPVINNSKGSSSTSTSTTSSNLSNRPLSGIYIKGIWVKSSKIQDTIFSFCGPVIDVSGRDRNDVDDDELMEAVSYILLYCNDQSKHSLVTLLQPLLGNKNNTSSKTTGKEFSSSSSSSSSWLLRTPRFFNRIIEMNRDYLLYDVFKFPHGSLFVSNKTTNNKDIFIKWASEFLKARSTPLIFIEAGSLKQLFEEVTEAQLTEKCADILLNENKIKLKSKTQQHAAADNDDNIMIMQNILNFLMGGNINSNSSSTSNKRHKNNINIVFSIDVTIAFVYENSLFLPQLSLSRESLIKILNVIQNQLQLPSVTNNSNSHGMSVTEGFTSLIQALFEKLPNEPDVHTRVLKAADIDMILKYAKTIQQINKSYFHNKNLSTSSSITNANKDGIDMVDTPTTATTTKKTSSSSSPSIQDLTDETTSSSSSSSSSATTRVPHQHHDASAHLLSQIENTKRRVNMLSSSASNTIIPASAFQIDQIERSQCLQPTSDLLSVRVSDSVGGGTLMMDSVSQTGLRTFLQSQESSSSSSSINNNNNNKLSKFKWDNILCQKICYLRNLLNDSINLVKEAIPSIHTFLPLILHGFDENITYEAFCGPQHIVINIAAFVSKLPSNFSFPTTTNNTNAHSVMIKTKKLLLHDFVVTVTHELAHMLEPEDVHGELWRNAHMALLQQIYADLLTNHYPGSKWNQLCSCCTTSTRAVGR